MQHLVVVAHPSEGSWTMALATAFCEAIAARGDTFQLLDLYREVYAADGASQLAQLLAVPIEERVSSPTANVGIRPKKSTLDSSGTLIPALVAESRAAVLRSDAITLLFPLWWMGFPALLKAWIDAVLALGFAFDLDHEVPIGKLEGRLVATIAAMGTDKHTYAADGSLEAMQLLWSRHIFKFCELNPVAHLWLANAALASSDERDHHLEEVRALAGVLSRACIAKNVELVARPRGVAEMSTDDCSSVPSRRDRRRSLTALSARRAGHHGTTEIFDSLMLLYGHTDSVEPSSVAKIDQFPWEDKGRMRHTEARIEFDEEALYVSFFADGEENPCATTHELNGPVHLDSCVEFFFAPWLHAEEEHYRSIEYVNLEVNVDGALHVGFGACRQERRLIPPKLAETITVQTMGLTAVHAGWRVAVRLPLKTLSEFVGKPIRCEGQWGCNFYRCGPTEHAPYSAWQTVTSSQPDFHRPEQFGVLKFPSIT